MIAHYITTVHKFQFTIFHNILKGTFLFQNKIKTHFLFLKIVMEDHSSQELQNSPFTPKRYHRHN